MIGWSMPGFMHRMGIIGILGAAAILLLHEVFSRESKFFFEFGVLVIVIILLVSAIVGMAIKTDWLVFPAIVSCVIHLLNVVYLYFTGPGYWLVLLAVVAAAGFILSIESLSTRLPLSKKRSSAIDENSRMLAMKPSIESQYRTVSRDVPADGDMRASTKGYVGDSATLVYHTADCFLSKMIGVKDRVWFTRREMAQREGYKAHICVI